MVDTVDVRVGLQQRIFPSYRKALFEQLAMVCSDGFCLFAGQARPEEHVSPADGLAHGAYVEAHNLHVGRGRAYFCVQTNILAWLRQWQPQVLIMEANPRYLSSHAALRWAKQHGVKVIGWGLGAPAGGKGLAGIFWRRFLGQFDALVAYSQKGASDYAGLGFPQASIFVAPNAVLSAPTGSYIVRPADGVTQILYVGRLQARKKADELITACAQLAREGYTLQLTIVGDGPERSALEKLTADILPDTVFTGALHGEQAAPFFQMADVFVLPGTGGLAVQEALTFGLPVIVAEADGTQSNMVREENGWLIDPNNPEGLQNALRAALSSPETLVSMGEESFHIARDEVNIETMVRKFAEAIHYVQDGNP
jgi:glycosyltransferase involved in cell wall biosynthesis